MGIAILVLIFAVPIIGTIVVMYLTRSGARSGKAEGKGGFAMMDRIAQGMPSGEGMYAMMFPDLAPLFQPPALLEWHAWFADRKEHRQVIRDGRRWHGEIPGFAGAATMSVKGEGEADLVVLQDKDGQTLVEMKVEQLPDGGRLTTGAGTFTLTPASADCKVRFAGTDRSFEWKSAGNWKFKSPMAQEAMHADRSGLGLAGGSGGTAGGGLMAGAAAGLIAQQALAARAKKDQQRAHLDTSY